MLKLLKMQLSLNVPKILFVMCLLGTMVLIPSSYPYILGVGYVIIAILNYLLFLNQDQCMQFCAMLPVKRKDIVSSTTAVVAIFQVTTIVISAICTPIAKAYTTLGNENMVGNVWGMDANLTFVAFELVTMATFNLVCLPKFFATGYKAGLPVLLGTVGFAVSYAILEIICQLPTLKALLDGYDVETLWARIVALALGVITYAVLTVVANNVATKKFEKVSL